MNWYRIFYWVTVADNAITFFSWLAGVSTLFMLVYWIVRAASADEEFWKSDKYKISRKRLHIFSYTILITLIIGWAGVVFTPSKRDCLMIIAGGSVASFLNSDSSAKSIPSDVAQFLHLSLKKEIDDLNTSSKEEKKKNYKEEEKEEKKSDIIDKLKEMSKDQLIDLIKKDSTIFK